METEAPSAPARAVARGTIARIVGASAITLLVLPYAWGRSLVGFLLTGAPERWFFLLLVAGVLATMLLSFRQGDRLDGGAVARLALGLASAWTIAIAALIMLSAGSLVPRTLVFLAFLPATFVVPWTAWLFFRPMSGLVRWGTLAALLACLGGSATLLKAEGLTGESRVNFVWRWQTHRSTFEGVASEAPAERIEIVPTPNDFPQYLGPTRQAIVPRAKLARDWDKRPPKQLWRRAIGAGWGSFAVVGDYAFTQEQRDAKECVVCYRVADGKEIWVRADATPALQSMGGPGPRATPTVAEGVVYAVGATGLLNALDAATGERKWFVEILEDNSGGMIAHGVCGSPLTVDDLVVVAPTGTPTASLVAYDRATGKRVWQAGQSPATYNSPMLVDFAGVRQILFQDSDAVAGYDPKTGKNLWRFEWFNSQHIHCSQPIPNLGGNPNHLFLAAGYDKGASLIEVTTGADGSLAAKLLWDVPRHRLQTKFTQAIEHAGYVWGLDGAILGCVDVATGKQYRKFARYNYGQILIAGDLLLVQGEDGEIVLVEPDPKDFQELGRIEAFRSRTWNNLALAGKFLLARNDREAACYELPLAAPADEKAGAAPTP